MARLWAVKMKGRSTALRVAAHGHGRIVTTSDALFANNPPNLRPPNQ